MFYLVLILASGLKLGINLPDRVNNVHSCLSVGEKAAEYYNKITPEDDKVVSIECLRNA